MMFVPTFHATRILHEFLFDYVVLKLARIAQLTSRTASKGELYDAHLRAVVLQARRVQMSEWLMFHQLRWGEGNLAYAPTPPELRVGESLHR